MTLIAPVITIDGPSCSGKGTLGKALANILQWRLLDSGAIYRVLALTAIYHQVPVDSEKDLLSLAINLDICFEVECGGLNVLWRGKDVSKVIRSEMVGDIASQIALLPMVREVMMHRQRKFLDLPGLIADGRDMGTVVFPSAPVKIFLNASPEERANRRMRQLQEDGFSIKIKRLLSTIKERDNRDLSRDISPLVPAVDALVLDSTYLTINELIIKIIEHAKQILVLS